MKKYYPHKSKARDENCYIRAQKKNLIEHERKSARKEKVAGVGSSIKGPAMGIPG